MLKRRNKTKSKTKLRIIKRQIKSKTRKRVSRGGGKAPRNTPWPPPRAARILAPENY